MSTEAELTTATRAVQEKAGKCKLKIIEGGFSQAGEVYRSNKPKCKSKGK
jgi:hypothetical protein